MDQDVYINYEQLSERDKLKKDYMKQRIDSVISELTRENREMYRLFNYYYGYRTNEDYRILEQNYGMGTPTKLKSIPLIKKHVDRLVSEFLIKTQSTIPRITCKDKKTITKIAKEKEDFVINNEMKEIDNMFFTNFNHFFERDSDISSTKGLYDDVSKDLKILRSKLDGDFVSEMEISAQHVLNNLRNSTKKNLEIKLRNLFTSLLICGRAYYKIGYERVGQTPEIETLHPVDVFHPEIANDGNIEDLTRCVWVERLSKVDVLNKYGHLMTNDDIEKVLKLNDYKNIDIDYYGIYPRYTERYLYYDDYGNEGETQDGDNYSTINDLIPVFHCEWISDNKEKKNGEFIYRQDLYTGMRLANDIYFGMKKVENPQRSIEDPYKTSLSLKGMISNQYNGKTFSLVKAGIHLQDKYDLLHFLEENTYALSGVKGQILDLALIPEALGDNFEERVNKYLSYRKNGTIIINSSEEGIKTTLNTIFNGYDDSIPVNSIEALRISKEQIELQMSSISGVYREMLGGIQQKDAVNNVNVGIQQSYIILQQYFTLMNNLMRRLYTCYLDVAKISLKKGFTGSYILGEERQVLFTLSANIFSFSDIDVHIGDNQSMVENEETIKQMAIEMLKAGSTDIELIIDMVGSKSITDLKKTVKESTAKRKEEAGTEDQLKQKLQELSEQNEQLVKEIEKLRSGSEGLDGQRFEFEKYKFGEELKLKQAEVDIKRDTSEKKAVNDDDKIKVELAQLTDDSPYNDKVNFNK